MSGYLQGKDMAGGEVAAPVKPVAKAVTIPSLLAQRAANNKIAMLTCYDASFASLMDRVGVEWDARLEALESPQGHDAFLLETEAVFRAVTDFRRHPARGSSEESIVSCLEVSS